MLTRNCLFNYEGGVDFNYNNTYNSPNLGILGNSQIEEVSDYNWATGEAFSRNALYCYSNVTIRRFVNFPSQKELQYDVVCSGNFSYLIRTYPSMDVALNLTVKLNATGGMANISYIDTYSSILYFDLIGSINPTFHLVVDSEIDDLAHIYVNNSVSSFNTNVTIPTFLSQSYLYFELELPANSTLFGENYNVNVPFCRNGADEYDLSVLSDFGTPGSDPDNPPIDIYEFNSTNIEVEDMYMERKQVISVNHSLYNNGYDSVFWDWNNSYDIGRNSVYLNFDYFSSLVYSQIRILNSIGGTVIFFGVMNGYIFAYDGPSFDDFGQIYTVSIDEWFQLAIEFNSTDYTFDLYLNNFPIANDLEWYDYTIGNPTMWSLRTATNPAAEFTIYIDELSIGTNNWTNYNYDSTDIIEIVGVSNYYYSFEQISPDLTANSFNYTMQNATLLHGNSYINSKWQNAMVLEGNGSYQELNFTIDTTASFDGSESFCVLMPFQLVAIDTQKVYFNFSTFYVGFYKSESSGRDSFVMDYNGVTTQENTMSNCRFTSVVLFIAYMKDIENNTLYYGYVSDESIYASKCEFSALGDLEISIAGTLGAGEEIYCYGGYILPYSISDLFPMRGFIETSALSRISKYYNTFWLPRFKQIVITIDHSINANVPELGESGYYAYYFRPINATTSFYEWSDDNLEILYITGTMWSNFNSTLKPIANATTTYFFPLIYQSAYELQINASIVIQAQPLYSGEYADFEDVYAYSNFTTVVFWWIYANPVDAEFNILNDIFDLITPLLLIFIFPYIIYSVTKKTVFGILGITIGAIVSIIGGLINTGEGILLIVLSFLIIAYVIRKKRNEGEHYYV